MQNIEATVENFKSYIKFLHPEIPNKINDVWISKILKGANNDFQKSVNSLKSNLETRRKHTDLFMNRNFFDEKMIQARAAV